jgi:hypothetical protein
MSAGLQYAGEKPVVVPGERPLRLWCGEDGDSCAIRRMLKVSDFCFWRALELPNFRFRNPLMRADK